MLSTFLVVLVAVGMLAGLIVVLSAKAHSKTANRHISQMLAELNIAFNSDHTFWASREWNDTLFTSQYKDIHGHLSAFANATPHARLESTLIKNSRNRTLLKQGEILQNGVKWLYAIGTYKVEGGTLVRNLYAVMGTGNTGLLFDVNMSRYGELNMIPDDAVDCVLSCFERLTTNG